MLCALLLSLAGGEPATNTCVQILNPSHRLTATVCLITYIIAIIIISITISISNRILSKLAPFVTVVESQGRGSIVEYDLAESITFDYMYCTRSRRHRPIVLLSN